MQIVIVLCVVAVDGQGKKQTKYTFSNTTPLCISAWVD
jgi:hypothetical protein